MLNSAEVWPPKAEKKTGLRVHGRTGVPCPVCGDTIREVSFSEDRRMSRLLR